MWVSFLIAFIWARVWVTYFSTTPLVGIENVFQMGGRTVIFGYHPHHIATGILFVAIAGFIGLHYSGRVITRIAAVLYGIGLGLIVDEVGFVVSGITYRDDFPEVFILVVTISAWLMSTVYFPSFWKAVDGKLTRTYARIAGWVLRHRGSSDPTQPTPSSAATPAETDDAAGTRAQ
jgi:hypothetical protein